TPSPLPLPSPARTQTDPRPRLALTPGGTGARPNHNAAVTVTLLGEIRLRAGGQAHVAVYLDRGNYGGPVKLQLRGAATGVSARPAEVKPGGQVGVLTVEATRDAAGSRLGLNEVSVVALVGDKVVGEGKLILRLEMAVPAAKPFRPRPKAFTDSVMR